MRSFILVAVNSSKNTCLYLGILLEYYFPKVLVLEMYINNQQPVAKTNKQINYNEYTSNFFIIILFSFMVSFLNRASWADKNGNCYVYTLCWTFFFKLTLEGQASITPSSLHLSGSSHGLFCWYHHVKGTRLPSVRSPNILWIPKKNTPALFFIYRSLAVLKLASVRTSTRSCTRLPCYKAQKRSFRIRLSVSCQRREANPRDPPSDLLAVPGDENICTPQIPCWGLRAEPHPAPSTVALHRSAHLHKGFLRSS